MTHPTHHTKLQSDMTGNTNMTADGDEMGGHTGAIRGVADTNRFILWGGSSPRPDSAIATLLLPTLQLLARSVKAVTKVEAIVETAAVYNQDVSPIQASWQ